MTTAAEACAVCGVRITRDNDCRAADDLLVCCACEERAVRALGRERLYGTPGGDDNDRGTAMTKEPETDPVPAMLASAPADNESLTEDDKRHIDEGWRAYRDRKTVSSEEAKQACLEPRTRALGGAIPSS